MRSMNFCRRAFCLRAELNSGQDNSHSECTLWTCCLRRAKTLPKPPPPTHTHTSTHTHTHPTRTHFQDTHRQRSPIFPFSSFTLKMLFCSVWRHILPSLPGWEVLPADAPQSVSEISCKRSTSSFWKFMTEAQDLMHFYLPPAIFSLIYCWEKHSNLTQAVYSWFLYL